MEEISDVVDENEIFRVSPKIQIKMQSRHNVMLNIQNITKIIGDIENAVNRYSEILKSMELNGTEPHFRLMGDFMIPVKEPQEAIGEITLALERLEEDLEKHIDQVKSMQKQHDGLTLEIDKLMEVEKGKYQAGQKNKEKLKKRRNR